MKIKSARIHGHRNISNDSMYANNLVIVDAHIHLHDCYKIDEFFDNAFLNLKSVAVLCQRENSFTGVLMFAESSGDNYFSKFIKLTDGTVLSNKFIRSERWIFKKTKEENSLIVTDGEKELLIVAGHQVGAAEDLEVLMLGTTKKVQDQLPIFDILEEAKHLNALKVIPWGAGKWLFSRGKILDQIIDSADDRYFFLAMKAASVGLLGEIIVFSNGRLKKEYTIEKTI